MEHYSDFLQPPVRNASVVGAHVYSHSGEFGPQVTDCQLPGRGISFAFKRIYRSTGHRSLGEMGRGWTFTYAKRLERDDDTLVYHDGFGRVHRFTDCGEGRYAAPAGFYSVLETDGERCQLKQRFGDVLVFDDPGLGGRLRAVQDRNGNALKFTQDDDALMVDDALGHRIHIAFADGLLARCTDHTGRAWNYIYDDSGCLVEVWQPARSDSAESACTRYGYDAHHRLVSVSDPNGNIVLRNRYDDRDRVVRQQHGDGAFDFEFHSPHNGAGACYQTRVRLKNGGRLTLEHDDAGHATDHVVQVSAASVRAGNGNGSVDVRTRSRYNAHGEVIERIYPAGSSTVQAFDEHNDDPRGRGNLVEVVHRPAPTVDSDQQQLRTVYDYEPRYQLVSSATDPRRARIQWEYDRQGNLSTLTYPSAKCYAVEDGAGGHCAVETGPMIEQFEHNDAGQLIRRTDGRGARTEHYYHSLDTIGALRRTSPGATSTTRWETSPKP